MPNIKFSDFTAEAEINNFEGVVGYNTTGNLNLRIAPLEMPARYDVDVFNTALGDSSTLRGTSIASGGERNVGVGILALENVTTALDNIAIGYNSLNTLTTFGQNSTGENIAIGTEAQFSNGASVGGAGDENVAIGHRALYANTGYDGVGTYEGMYNIAVGGKSLEDVNQGDRNTAIGHNSGNTITLGYSNCLMGFEVGAGAISGNSMLDQQYAIGIGQWAVPQGNGSIVIGYQAEATNALVSPVDTIVIGRESTCNMQDNIVIGANSTYTGVSATDTGKSILIGSDSTVTDQLVYSANGKNTIVGSFCDVTGNYHTHVGYYAIITGEDNASVGYFNEIYGTNNVGIGDNSYIGTGASDANNCVALGGDISIPGGSNGSICIGAGTQATLSNAFEIGFGGSFGVPATNDIILVGANGGTVASSKIDVINDLIITTGTGTLQVGDFQGQGNSQFTAPVNIQNTTTGGVSGPVSPDFSGGNIITWTLAGDIQLNAPTIPIIAGGTTAGTYIMIINNPGGAFNITAFNAVYKWSGGTGSFPGIGANTAIITWVGDGTNFYGTIAQNFS